MRAADEGADQRDAAHRHSHRLAEREQQRQVAVDALVSSTRAAWMPSQVARS